MNLYIQENVHAVRGTVTLCHVKRPGQYEL